MLAPEAITDYPNLLDLSPELQSVLGDRSRWQAAGADVDGSHAEDPHEFYMNRLGRAPGWKVGGWPPWGRTDPTPPGTARCARRG